MAGDIMKLAIALEEKREKAMMSSDASLLGSMFSEDLSYGHSSGYAESKADYLKNFAAGNYAYRFIKTTVKKVFAIGHDGLVITGELINEANLFGTEVKMHSVYLAVWRLEGDAWRFLAHQTALIKT
jgi:hypothetical protein